MGNNSSHPQSDNWLNNLQIQEFLGGGSYGKVFSATQATSPGQKFAIKIAFANPTEYDSSDVEDVIQQETWEVMEREFHNTKNLNHANIVRIFNSSKVIIKPGDLSVLTQSSNLPTTVTAINKIRWRSSNNSGVEGLVIKMELCGKTLRSWLTTREQKWNKDLILGSTTTHEEVSIIQGLTSGMQYLHQNQIMHRDLKPDNIFFTLSNEPIIKIGDFGLSRRIHKDTSRTGDLTSRQGNLMYSSPEWGSRQYSFSSDIFSLGLIIYEVTHFLLCEERWTTFQKLATDETGSLVKTHEGIHNLKYLITHMTKRNVKDRMQSLDNIALHLYDRTPASSEEFAYYVQNSGPGDLIKLQAGTYKGHFHIKCAKLTIEGSRTGQTMIIGGMIIEGNRCAASSLVFSFDSPKGSAAFLSDEKHLEKNCGIIIKGQECIVKDILIHGFPTGVTLGGLRNNLEQFVIKACKIGIEVSGQHNTMANITIYPPEFGDTIGIKFTDGAENELSSYRVQGGENGWGIYIDEKTATLRIYDSPLSGAVMVRGKGHMLRNVGCEGTQFMVFDKQGKLNECPAAECGILDKEEQVVVKRGLEKDITITRTISERVTSTKSSGIDSYPLQTI